MVSMSSSPIAYTIAGSCQASGFSRSAIYRLIKQGELRAVKHGKRTLILERDLRKLLEKLPVAGARRPNRVSCDFAGSPKIQ
jgi:excisionase family DNA binding protein